jgi:hypothetical protein
MRRDLVLFLATFTILVTAGCASLKPACIIKDKVVAAVTTGIVTKLECANSFAVKADVDRVIESLGVCKTGPIAEGLCPLACKTVVDALFTNVVPKEWACKSTAAKATVYAAALEKCLLIPVKYYP